MDRSLELVVSLNEAAYLLHHVFLPPKVPQHDDFSPDMNKTLLRATIQCLAHFKSCLSDEQAQQQIDLTIVAISNLEYVQQNLKNSTQLSVEKLDQALQDLPSKGGCIPLHIRAQNAGVLVSKVDENVHFEMFELSPSNQAVYEVKGRIRRSFPACAVSLKIQDFGKSDLRTVLVSTLATMSNQSAKGTLPQAKKKGKMHDEDRDTVHPKMVTELFQSFLLAIGEPVQTSIINKNTREEVFWNASRSPWHRSPLWLLIRVTLQLTLSRAASAQGSESMCLYKPFMVHFMASILLACQNRGLENDFLHAMNCKVARRLRKLASDTEARSLCFIHTVLRKTNALLLDRWETIQKTLDGDSKNMSPLKNMRAKSHCLMKLSAMDAFIASISKRSKLVNANRFSPTSTLSLGESADFPASLPDIGDNTVLDLAILEDWVANHLQSWLASHNSDIHTTGAIRAFVEGYHRIAKRLYTGNPEAMSIMALTIVELWVAADISAVKVCALLKQYSPLIPHELLQNLLLPKKSQIRRLLRAESYIASRSAAYSSIFTSFGKYDSFSVRYFAQSSPHQELKAKIEAKAEIEKQEKIAELARQKQEYERLMGLYYEANCEYQRTYNYRDGSYSSEHSGSCHKCAYQKRANSLAIDIHEWPLPSNPHEAAATVFELLVPASFGHWRDLTMYVRHDVLSMRYTVRSTPRASFRLPTYPALQSYFTSFVSQQDGKVTSLPPRSQRILPLSEDKPHTATHRKSLKVITATKSNVCLQNGLHYHYLDDGLGIFVSDLEKSETFYTEYTYELPARSSTLQDFLLRPAEQPSGPSPNTVIATQSQCPEHMTLEQYKALCSLPLGFRIQWQNILVQLKAPSVDFAEEETILTVLQCIHQTGPASSEDVLRDGHAIVDDPRFAGKLLDGLHESLQRLKENWQSARAVSIFIALAARVLSLSSSATVQERCLAFLEEARAIAFGWACLLKEKASLAAEDSARKDFRAKATEIALISVGTFDIDESHLLTVLEAEPAASILLQCSIAIQENTHVSAKSSNLLESLLRWRWKRAMFRSYPMFIYNIVGQKSRALDDAIAKCWAAYKVCPSWSTVSEKHDYWLAGQTSCGQDGAIPVHYNLLTGELLVNGLPLARLPAEYERDPMYRHLFGTSTIEVMPTTVPGMSFSGRKAFFGYTLQFGRQSDNSSQEDFLIQGQKDGHVYDLVPRRLLKGLFPTRFVEEYIHWYHHERQCIEFRPLCDPWGRQCHSTGTDSIEGGSAGIWTMLKSSDTQDQWQLSKGDLYLVNVKSSTANTIASILSPIEEPLSLHTIYHASPRCVEVLVPRLEMGFFLIAGTALLRSCQFRGMVIDENQSIGTLVGLKSRLILRPLKDTGRRMLLVPGDNISYAKQDDHIAVKLNKRSPARAYTYQIDDQLGRLVDDGSIYSKLVLCYLHALTSFCLPDKLTNKTGTEQALTILRSAGLRSFHRLTATEIAMLAHISSLSPSRDFYPQHERVMQQVSWSSRLGFLAQHGDFHELVKDIFNQASQSDFFYDKPVALPQLAYVQPILAARDKIRASTFRVAGFGAEAHTHAYDMAPRPRDRDLMSSAGLRAHAIAATVFQDRPLLHRKVPDNLKSHLWSYLRGASEVSGSRKLPHKIQYDAVLLEDARDIIPNCWIAIQQALSRDQPTISKYHVMMWLATIAFSGDVDMTVLQVLAMLFIARQSSQIVAPIGDAFQLQEGITPHFPHFSSRLGGAFKELAQCPEAHLSYHHNESYRSLQSRKQSLYKQNQTLAVKAYFELLEQQWPCQTPNTPQQQTGNWPSYLIAETALKQARANFASWFRNRAFDEYLSQIIQIIPREFTHVQISSGLLSRGDWLDESLGGFISNDAVFDSPTPTIPDLYYCDRQRLQSFLRPSLEAETPKTNVAPLITRLTTKAESPFEEAYVKDLEISALTLEGRTGTPRLAAPIGTSLRSNLEEHLSDCKERVETLYALMITSITKTTDVDDRQVTVPDIYQLPRLSPVFFLERLNRKSWERTPESWKDCILEYAKALADLQRAERLLALVNDDAALVKELGNPGHENWNPRDHPETLLLEVESGIMIRKVQEEISAQMRNPPDGKNAVMQLNMGEGKSSVIVPMVATALADGTRIVRVVVAKAQAKQMFQMLTSKLGGLLNRRIYHMPFSRAVKVEAYEANEILEIHQNCMANGGVLLVQPEHILSFKLMGIEKTLSGNTSSAVGILRTQRLLEKKARDIVDESDENFSVKFELVYTMGTQQPTDHSPERWVIIHEVLSILQSLVPTTKAAFPLQVEVSECCPGSFPRTRVLRPDVMDSLLSLVADRVCVGGLMGLTIPSESEEYRSAVLRYISKLELEQSDIDAVEKGGPAGFWADKYNDILLLRGLIAGGVLQFVFCHKRWRVDYGLDSSRQPQTRLAVPYRAKDNPSARSEFSHPDVVILLTSLSYYYGGLDDHCMFLAFHHLMESDQAPLEYQMWVKDSNKLPLAFTQLSGINLEDRHQCVDQVFPCLRNGKSVVDYFLSHIVFPKEMKEFPHKLSASGWDIAETKTHPTTGFSGTKDSRNVLPLSIDHLDLPEQRHTNALVLEYLLQPENSITLMKPRGEGSGTDAERLLTMITEMDPPVRVVLDVGAQILEMNNLEVARAWMRMLPDDEKTQAVVFFDDHDNICVVDRKGGIQTLQTSPFASHLDVCLIFLDEAHTRGTDLKLPLDYRAAVTLGANLTKDRLVQACMRMRQLGHGQSVVFCVPEEIKTKIHVRTSPTAISVLDILEWAISETWIDARRSMPLWAVQGRRHKYHAALWAGARAENKFEMTQDHAKEFLDDEAPSIEDRYTPILADDDSKDKDDSGDKDEDDSKDGLKDVSENTSDDGSQDVSDDEDEEDLIAERCREFNTLDHKSATLQEEQERELAPEIEQERHVQRPPPATPQPHSIHPDVRSFVTKGTLVAKSIAYMPAFGALRDTTAAKHFNPSRFPGGVLVTRDFSRTVQPEGTSFKMDSYQRSVQWILTSQLDDPQTSGSRQEVLMVISPFEANELLPIIKKSTVVSLDLYAPRPNLGYSPLDGLTLYTVPVIRQQPIHCPFIIELNLFSGQLYANSFQEYQEICAFVKGLSRQHGDAEKISSATFLKVLMTKIRRNCDSIDKTHMGCILNGRLLRESDFE